MAAFASFRFSTLAILVIAGNLVLAGHKTSAQFCELSIPNLVSRCSQYVQGSGPKIPPSQACCNVVKNLDIPCVCKLVTPDTQKLVNMDKVVFVARSCGTTLQPGMQCGSFVVPPPV